MKTEMKTTLRRKRMRRVFLNTLYKVLIIVAVTSSLTIGYRSIKKEADTAKEKIDYTRMEMLGNGGKVQRLSKTHNRLADELYEACNKYYKNSEDEVFKRVYKKRIPDEKTYKGNPGDTFVVIYALMRNYPDMKKDKKIAEVLEAIDVNAENLATTASKYNTELDAYNEMISSYNQLFYCKLFFHHKIAENQYSAIIVQ